MGKVVDWQVALRERGQIIDADRLPELRPANLERLHATLKKKYTVRLAVEKRLSNEKAPALRSAHAFLVAAAPPVESPGDDSLALLFHLTQSRRTATMSRLLCELYGIPAAVSAWARAAFLKLRTSVDGTLIEESSTPNRPVPETWFRAALLRASEREQQQASSRVAHLLESSDLTVRAMVIERFVHETEWAKQLAEAFVAANPAEQTSHNAMVLQGVLRDFDLAVAVARKAGPNGTDFETLLARFGEAAFPIVYELAGEARHGSALERAGRALAVVPTEEAASFFADNFGKKSVRKHAIVFFPRFPELSSVLIGVAEGRSRTARDASALLEACERMADTQGREASAEDLPTILVEPPWDSRSPKPRRRRRRTICREPLPGPVAYHGPRRDPDPRRIPMNQAELETWKKRVAAARAGEPDKQLSLFYGPSSKANQRTWVPPDVQLDAWNEGWPRKLHSAMEVGWIVAEHGEKAAPGLISWAQSALPKTTQSQLLKPVVEFEHPELAPLLTLALNRPALHEIVCRWLARFPTAAAAGLVPAALDKASARQRGAARGVRYLISRGHEDEVRRRAAELGPLGTDALDDLLAEDPRLDCLRRPPKLGPRVRADSLPRPRLADGRLLPVWAVQRIVEMLAFSPRLLPYAGLLDVRKACEPHSLAELAWSLAHGWESAGERLSETWMCDSLVHFADEEVVRRTTPALRSHRIVDVLRTIGTDAAAMELATIAMRGLERGSGYRNIYPAAETALDAIARDRGLSRDALDERLTPSLGLTDSGELELDYGPRSFTVTFDEHLAPQLRDDSGRKRKRLPKAARHDDAERVEAARRAFEDLCEDVETLAIYRIDALERAMLGGRRWETTEFRQRWARHPLMTHLARRVVFVSSGTTFRVAEDGTMSTVDDDRFELRDDAVVEVPHPLRWPDESLQRWQEVFADYELVQPFDQLHRAAPIVTDDEVATSTFSRTLRNVGGTRTIGRRLREQGFTKRGSNYERLLGDGSSAHVHVLVVGEGQDCRTQARVRRFRGGAIPWNTGPLDELLAILDTLSAAPPS